MFNLRVGRYWPLVGLILVRLGWRCGANDLLERKYEVRR